MRVLIAGGAGFIGSHLVDALLARGDEVLVIDNLVTGRHGNLDKARKNAGLQFLEADICVPLNIPGAWDAILHLASPASPYAYQKHQIATLDAGTLGTRQLLEVAAHHNARFLLASTSEVYGDPAEHPQTETYWGNVNPVGMRSMYDEAKRCSEAFTMAFQRERRIRTSIARIFNTYGGRMQSHDGRAVPTFVSSALTDDDVTVYGDGSHTRSLCHVDDLVRGLLLLLDSSEPKPINLGNPAELSMVDLAQRVIDACGSSSRIVFQQLPPDDPLRRCPDISRARSILGWEPTVNLADGLRTTIDWFRNNRG